MKQVLNGLKIIRKRSPFELIAGKTIKNDVSFFNNCKVWKTKTFLSDSGNLKNGIVFNYPENIN